MQEPRLGTRGLTPRAFTESSTCGWDNALGFGNMTIIMILRVAAERFFLGVPLLMLPNITKGFGLVESRS